MKHASQDGMKHTTVAHLAPTAQASHLAHAAHLARATGASVALLVLVALGLPGAQAQAVYRIVGADGRVTFSDKPPVTADKVTATDRTGRTLDLSGTALPYDLRQIVSRFPVTLYTSTNCDPCASGRSLLTGRGIPFSERTVNTAEDADALTRISGENSLPFLTIGGQKIKGFSDSEWVQFLDAAGYPASSKLPSAYRNAPATPLVAVQKPTPAAQADATQNAAAKAAAAAAPPAPVDSGANPAGIRF